MRAVDMSVGPGIGMVPMLTRNGTPRLITRLARLFHAVVAALMQRRIESRRCRMTLRSRKPASHHDRGVTVIVLQLGTP